MKTFLIVVNGVKHVEFASHDSIEDVKHNILNTLNGTVFQCGYFQQSKYVLCFINKD